MEILQESKDTTKTFFGHVFSTTEEGKAEMLNVAQYAILGLVPVFILNKLIQRFVPEADLEKSSLELLVEIFVQLTVIFLGVILIHRVITYVPTYSGFKYEHLTITNAILPFLVIILSIQSKLGLKSNILYDRLLELWNGHTEEEVKYKTKKTVRINAQPMITHIPSQADHLDDGAFGGSGGMLPPPQMSTNMGVQPPSSRAHAVDSGFMQMEPMPANFSGSPFGSSF